MSGEITFTAVGNLTADPELRYTQKGVAVANFTIAVTPREFDRAANEWKDGEPVFLRSTIWRAYAEHTAASLKKGNRVMATGVLTQKSYETKEGDKRTSFEFEVSEMGPALRYCTAELTPTPKNDDNQGGESHEEEN